MPGLTYLAMHSDRMTSDGMTTAMNIVLALGLIGIVVLMAVLLSKSD